MSWLLRSRRSSAERRQHSETAVHSRANVDEAQNSSNHRRRRRHHQLLQQPLSVNGPTAMGNDVYGRHRSTTNRTQDVAADTRPPQSATVVINRFGLLELDLSDRDLRDIPDAVFSLGRLEVLRAARNRLRGVSADVAALHRLRVLDVGNNELVALPDSLANCVRLAELDVRGNRLMSLPPRLLASLSQSLRTLRLAGNRFDCLPDDIGRLTALGFLDASGNRLRDLPPSVGRLQQLRVLNLSDNGFDVLPECVCQLSRLETLEVSHNRLSDLPTDLSRLGRLRELRLSANRFDVLPDAVCRTSTLVVLDLSDNSLTTVPSALSRLPRLVELNLQRNALDSFPDDAGPLNLERLNVSANRLRRLSVVAMRCLRRLDADGNWLTEMPRGVYQLAALEALSVAGNRITHLSSNVSQLSRLRLLDISDNSLRSLPKVLERMSGLVTLNVAGNDLKPPKGQRSHASRHSRDPTATSKRKQPVSNGPLPTFVVSADPSTRAVYTSPILATPNGDLLYRPPLPPSPAKSGSRVRGLFRRKVARDTTSNDRVATVTSTSTVRPHHNNDVQFSSLSNRRSASATPGPRRSLARQDASEPVPLSADEATRRSRAVREDNSLYRRPKPPGAVASFRSRSVNDLRGVGTLDSGERDHVRATDDGWPTGTIRGSRLANVGRLAAAGIDLGHNPATMRAGGSWPQPDSGGEDDTRSDDSLFGWNNGNNVDDDEDDHCSDTVTVNEAIGDELSLGEDDFEFLPTNVQDSKLKRIADDLETLLNRQLLQPLIGDNAQ